jgi:hypothetical protein
MCDASAVPMAASVCHPALRARATTSAARRLLPTPAAPARTMALRSVRRSAASSSSISSWRPTSGHGSPIGRG